MVTDIERQFFDTFGIEPEYQDACTVEDKYWDNEELANEYGTFDQYMNCKCGNQENCTTECSCAYQKEIYPQITDRILLELICIANKELIKSMHARGENTEELKNNILKTFIEDYTFYSKTYEKTYNRLANNFKQQVQSLFKEG